MTFRRSNQKPRTKKSHVMEQIFLSLVKNMKNSQRIRENRFTKKWNLFHEFYTSKIIFFLSELLLSIFQNHHQKQQQRLFKKGET